MQPLSFAIEKIEDENVLRNVITLLLDYGADVNAQDKDGSTPLMYASRTEFGEVVRELIKRGADMENADRYHTKALTESINYGQLEAMKILLENGADIYGGVYDTSAFFAANKNGNKDAVKILLEFGFDPNKKLDEESLPLMEALYEGNDEIIEILLGAGADVNLIDKLEGISSLEFAEAEQMDIYDLLKKYDKKGTK